MLHYNIIENNVFDISKYRISIMSTLPELDGLVASRTKSMFPSSTVENYLKAAYLEQSQLLQTDLVPMGRLAAALGVVPGTATTMVKALAESGLVVY